ncbi:MAG: DegQ family serine endoprotease [Betaproteobacteria bacterium]|nr:DegQ family serine endoprotease [Betaproteobacteria bacterium]MDE2622461.1 DegQ family serine endoprotease [Betaproteobacteria bacterium]
MYASRSHPRLVKTSLAGKLFSRQGAVLWALLAAFSTGYAFYDHAGITTAKAESQLRDAPPPVSRSVVGAPDFTGIVAANGPAVVNISVTGTMKAAQMDVPDFFGEDSPFSEFFHRFGIPGAPAGNGGRIQSHAEGSGFIVSPDGIVLTNAHVVADADEVVVKLTDRREFKAKVIGLDKTADVAVLRIDAKNLPTVRIGNPQEARVGEWVLAIGSPFGFENSVTAGIISAKSRTLPDEGYVPFMQTDVAINPGNSGGPLFNAEGEVIGINSQIYTRSGGYQGLSFAIPIDVAMNVEQQLLTKGKVSRGRLGVMIQEVDQGLADSFGLGKPQGALVASVEPGSPAARAGIEAGDVILKFNGKPIESSSTLPALVATTRPGTESHIEVWRHGKPKELSVRIGEVDNIASAAASKANVPGGKLGLAVRPLLPQEKLPGDTNHGLVVENVSDGPAAQAGIRPGDVIVSVNGIWVDSADQLRIEVAHAGKTLALLVQRGEQRLFVPIRIS